MSLHKLNSRGARRDIGSHAVVKVLNARSMLALLALLLLCACGKRAMVQAPFDSFVCFDRSFDQCVATTNLEAVQRYFKATYGHEPGQSGYVSDNDDGTTLATKDGKYLCEFGKPGFELSLDPGQPSPAVFVSPVLLSQIEEQRVRLDRAREACRRLVASYDNQLEVLALQDELSAAQKASSELSNITDTERLSTASIGNRALTADEATRFKLPASTNVRDAFNAVRTRVASAADVLRERSKVQVIDVEYQKSFADANLLIQTHLRELDRELFVLDRSTVRDSATPWRANGYMDGAWVEKGTVVLKGRVNQP